ncbi:MAG: phosphate acyltransferase [Betaproteobacteria bacterium TMED156]|nr:MAG: phosphate acyltransferase [Betaproteobacteria bacterium TMED156]
MPDEIRLAVDVMGGDHGPKTIIPACINYLNTNFDVSITMVGDVKQIKKVLREIVSKKSNKFCFDLSGNSERLNIFHTDKEISMNDAPSFALKNGKESSMWKAIEITKEGKTDAVVSAGNTGALMAIARFLLRTLPGIDRPAIASALPNKKGISTTVLDLGANIECSPSQLFQFASMGSALVSVNDLIPNPTIGLLNIGEENIKGNEVVKETSKLLESSNLNFVGNVEGDDIFNGSVNVVVCDGFVGNIVLKSSEGLAQMIINLLKEEYKSNSLSKLAAFISSPVLKKFGSKIDHRRYNGAALVGLRGVVYKSHGSADSFGFEHAIERAVGSVRNGLNVKIIEALNQNN